MQGARRAKAGESGAPERDASSSCWVYAAVSLGAVAGLVLIALAFGGVSTHDGPRQGIGSPQAPVLEARADAQPSRTPLLPQRRASEPRGDAAPVQPTAHRKPVAAESPAPAPAPAPSCSKAWQPFDEACAKATSAARHSWAEPHPWVAAKPEPTSVMADADWASLKDAKGCCTVGSGVPLDYTLRKVFGDGKKLGLAIESGANDGVVQSNTVLFAQHRGWGSLLVEPFPTTFARLAKNRCSRSEPDHARSICLQQALVEDSASKPVLRLVDNNLMAKEVGSGGTQVKTARMGDILDEHFRRPDGRVFVDLWSLDIEGAELGALRGVDWSRQRPTFVLVETSVFEQIDAFLTAVGYDLVRGAVATGPQGSISGWTHETSHRDYLWRDRFAGSDVPEGPAAPVTWPPV